MDTILLGLSLVVVLSVLARLVASWIRVPAIVPLLVVGVLAGTSVTGVIDPDKLLGDALSPAVQIAVGIILFEGALGLKRDELAAGVRPAVTRLITFGVLITWALASLAVIWLFDVPHPVGILIGAVLIVSGPTVVLPILDFIGPSARVRSVLKWEGILVDPIGAIIAVVVFGSLASEGGRAAFDLVEILLSLGSGLLVGGVAAVLLMPLLASRKLANRDKVAATLMVVVASFAAADSLFDDSGLVATIVMGVALANQNRVKVDYIAEFKETLVPILIGILFVLLAANVDIGDVIDLGWAGLGLIGILVLIVRPIAVATMTGLPFSWQEKAFFSAMAPRGIIAASTASAFGLELTQQGVEGAELIIPITFLVITGTVLVYALGSPGLARILGVAREKPASLVLIGAPSWALELGNAIVGAGAQVRVWTEDEREARAAEEADLIAFGGPLDAHAGTAGSNLTENTSVALVSGDDTLNQVLGYHLAENLEPDQIFRLRSTTDSAPIMHSAATPLFADVETVGRIEKSLADGGRIEAFGADDELPERAMPLALIKHLPGGPPVIRLASGSLAAPTRDRDRLIALVPASVPV